MPKGFKAGGRKKGTPNKTSKIVDDVLSAFKTLGRDKWLVERANEDPRAFLQLLSKVIPNKVEGFEEDGSLKITVSFPKND